MAAVSNKSVWMPKFRGDTQPTSPGTVSSIMSSIRVTVGVPSAKCTGVSGGARQRGGTIISGITVHEEVRRSF